MSWDELQQQLARSRKKINHLMSGAEQCVDKNNVTEFLSLLTLLERECVVALSDIATYVDTTFKKHPDLIDLNGHLDEYYVFS